LRETELDEGSVKHKKKMQ